VLSPKELNFYRDVVADSLHSSDNFSWTPKGRFYLNCWKSQLERSWYCSCVLFALDGRSAVLFHIEMMNRMWFVWLIVSLSLLGCAGFDLGEPANLSELSATQSDDEGEKNLAAIRVMMTKERQRTSFTPESGDEPKSERESSSWPPDWLLQYFSPSRSSLEESALSSEYVVSSSSSSALSTRRTASGNITTKSPWVPKSSSHGSEAEPWPYVPPYTLSAPAGSVYPGTIRCMPDMLGGQRCHAD
jgi:hypothetical protein